MNAQCPLCQTHHTFNALRPGEPPNYCANCTTIIEQRQEESYC